MKDEAEPLKEEYNSEVWRLGKRWPHNGQSYLPENNYSEETGQ